MNHRQREGGMMKMRTYIDTHAHMDRKRFDSNRKDIIELSHTSGIEFMVNPAIGYETNYSMRKYLDKYDFIKYAVGIHPNSVGEDENVDAEWDEGLLKLLSGNDKTAKTVAIGETGLDFHRITRDDKGELDEAGVVKLNRQYTWFRKQIKIASELKLPMILHIRNADVENIRKNCELDENVMPEYVDAHMEAIKILKEFDDNLPEGIKGVVHCFISKKLSDAEEYIKMGYMLGIGGAFTYPENEELKEIIRQVPLEYIVLETDSPFVLPAEMPENPACPGKRNTPLNIPYIAEQLAELKGISVDEVAAITTENAKRLFRM